ncbi:MAG: GMC family oxidoreductase [Arachidicoccus sp.]|nr:GMC family oxidoreductase [Arachidicoccus sp.]
MNLNTEADKQNTYDAIVIGSGISGGWAAKELTEKGMKVLMLERGQNIEHIKDYTKATLAPWQLKHRNNLTEEQRKAHPVQSRDYPYQEANETWWVNDIECPYTEIKPFDWFRGYHVGGRSLMWGRQSYRFSDINFEDNLKDGHGVDWPVRYKEVAPWYDYAETFAGVNGQAENWPTLPDGKFLPPMELNFIEKTVKQHVEEHYKRTRIITIGRSANLTQDHNGRTQCQYRDRCSRGCPFGAYFSTQSATLPAAVKTGNLTLRPFSIVNHIIYDKDSKKATGVFVIDAETNKTMEFYAKIIFVNASTLGTAFILLNSTSPEFPNGLGNNESGRVGRNLMDHHFRCGARGESDDFQDKYVYGRRPNGVYVPRYQNIGGDKRDFLRGFGYQGGGGRGNMGGLEKVAEYAFGADFKEAIGTPGKWSMSLGGFGEMLPNFDNRVYIDNSKKDKWGQPVLAVDCTYGDNEAKMRKAMMDDAAEMLEIAGLKNVSTFDAGCTPGMAIHEMGTACMGNDPKTSVLNKWNQLHEVKNVFVTDGSFMNSTACQNPSLTYMAFTARACDYAVNELKKQNI